MPVYEDNRENIAAAGRLSMGVIKRKPENQALWICQKACEGGIMRMTNEKVDLYTILASSVHDMKNSLTLLLATIDNMTEDGISRDDPAYGNLLRVKYEANRVNNDLVQFLALYRIENSLYNVNIASCTVYDFLEKEILIHRPLLDFKGIEIILDCDPGLGWFFDRELVTGALNNVLNNLYRYTKDTVKIGAKVEDDYLVISVEDNGEGYPESLINGDIPSSRTIDFTTGRTGLGIYFASIAAQAHKDKGKEGYISMANGGTFGGACFRIHLP